MDKQKRRGCKVNSDSEQKLANQNYSFPLCPYASTCPQKRSFKDFFIYFLQIKPKINKKKYAYFGYRRGKLASNLKINITKMEKMLISEKFIMIFAKIWTKKRKLS